MSPARAPLSSFLSKSSELSWLSEIQDLEQLSNFTARSLEFPLTRVDLASRFGWPTILLGNFSLIETWYSRIRTPPKKRNPVAGLQPAAAACFWCAETKTQYDKEENKKQKSKSWREISKNKSNNKLVIQWEALDRWPTMKKIRNVKWKVETYEARRIS